MAGKKRNLEILAPAQRELEEIAQKHLEYVDTESARRIMDRIYAALELLRDQPNMGAPCRERDLRRMGYRKLISGRYLCYYRQIRDTVYVYHILDSRTNHQRTVRGN